MDDDDLSFLYPVPDHDLTGTIIILLPDSTVSQIRDVNPLLILERCPLLYHAFEYGANGFQQANIEATSRSAVVSLLKYLYTGSYCDYGDQGTLLKHAEVFKVAQDFDIATLQVSAYANFTTKTEVSCCSSAPPPDLPDTARFLYKYLASHQSRQEQTLIDTLLHYCLSMFSYQNLGQNEHFRQVVYDVPGFHKDLCRVSVQRNFEDDGALDLVRLPVPYEVPQFRVDAGKQALYDLWQDPDDPASMPVDHVEQHSVATRKQPGDATTTLAFRPGNPVDSSRLLDPTPSEREDHGFTLVHRPKPEGNSEPASATEDADMSAMSSPELVSALDREYDSEVLVEDEWSLL